MRCEMEKNSALATRRAALRRLLTAAGLETVYLTTPAMVRYFSGYTGTEAAMLCRGARRWLITDSRYQEAAALDAPECKLTLWKKSMADTAAEILKKSAGRKIGVEAESLSFGAGEVFRRAGIKPVPLPAEFAGVRQVKNAAETAAIKKAVKIAEDAFTEFRPRLRAGMTELDIKAELEYLALRRGAEGMSFPTIVAIGANSSLPHAQAGKNRLKAGVPLLIDFGVFADGYASDLTRTLFFGKMPPFWRKHYQLVLDAQLAGIAAIKAGISGKIPDEAAREVFRRAGVEEYFIHSLGHGFGLEIHEAPRLSRFAGILPPGSVVTVEPGLYFPGKGGIRIEDDVRVTAERGEVLSGLPKSLNDCVL